MQVLNRQKMIANVMPDKARNFESGPIPQTFRERDF